MRWRIASPSVSHRLIRIAPADQHHFGADQPGIADDEAARLEQMEKHLGDV